MFLLRFTVRNHGSFRDEAELTLVKSRLRTAIPPEGRSWMDYTGTVAAIYGANASGKSQLLDAIRYLVRAVRSSATDWTDRKSIPRAPFRLDETSRDAPSEFVVDFVHKDVRYEYGFAVSRESVLEEWLYYYPTGRKRILFERGEDARPSFGRALKGGEARIRGTLGKRELVLSKGALLGYSQLAEIADAISDGVEIARFNEEDRQVRLRNLMHDILDARFHIDDIRTMLKVADVGISGAGVTSKEADARTKRLLRAFLEVADESDVIDEDEFQRMLTESGRALLFEHSGMGDNSYKLPSSLQSTGTLTWLSLAAPAVATIRSGGVFVVDELDSSLHPQLAQVMIQMFQDPLTNPRHAQLIFTTHDTYFLSPRSRVSLSPDEVFFVEKDRTGVSSVFSLADFPQRSDYNYAARYLAGRYGAVPTVAPAFLARIVEEREDTSSDSELAALEELNG